MLHNSGLFQGAPDICLGDLDMAVSLARVIKENPIANDMRLSLSEIAQAPEANQRTTIAGLGRNEQGEDNANEECQKALNYTDCQCRAGPGSDNRTDRGRSIATLPSHWFRIA